MENIHSKNRVVITGIGIANPLGIDKEDVWQAVMDKRSAIVSSPPDILEEISCPVCAYVPRDILIPSLKNKKSSKFMAKDALLGIKAAGDALKDASYESIENWSEKIGIFAATGITFADKAGFYTTIIESLRESLKAEMEEKGMSTEDFDNKLVQNQNPFLAFSILTSMSICHTSIEYGLVGTNMVLNSLVNQSVNSFIEAYQAVKHGDVSYALVGATESRIHVGGCQAMKFGQGMYNKDFSEEYPSKPMDVERTGAVPSEGAAFFFIESLESAKSRGLKPYAEIVGFGQKNVHSDREDEAVDSCIKAVLNCMDMGGYEAKDIGFVLSGAASDIKGDREEGLALEKLFKDTNGHIWYPKANYGEMGVGSFFNAAALGAMAFIKGELPENIGINKCEFDLGQGICKAPDGNIETAIITAFDVPNVKSAVILRRVAT